MNSGSAGDAIHISGEAKPGRVPIPVVSMFPSHPDIARHSETMEAITWNNGTCFEVLFDGTIVRKQGIDMVARRENKRDLT